MDKESIVLGSGDLYIAEFEGKDKELPTHEEIETEENRLGHIKGGASLDYTPSFYEAKDDMGRVSKVIITEEEALLKSGIMTWCGLTLEKLCQTARVTEKNGKRIVKIGGVGNATGKKYILRFVYKDEEDGDIRITIVGNNQAGFSIAFAKDGETIIDAEFKAQPMDKEGTLILYEEDIEPVTEEETPNTTPDTDTETPTDEETDDTTEENGDEATGDGTEEDETEVTGY